MNRLINSGLLQYEVSSSGRAERYRAGKTSHTIHVWWARRPHSAMRALVFAALCKTNSAKTRGIMQELAGGSGAAARALEQARELLADQYAHLGDEQRPRVLDMFGGGGTISYEAANLGLEAHAIDVNELSVFIHKANLVYSQQVTMARGIGLVRESGERVLRALAAATAHLFPLRAQAAPGHEGYAPSIYYWTYSLACQFCEYRFFLSRRPWLSKRRKRRVGLVARAQPDGEEVVLEQELDPDHVHRSAWVGRTSKLECPSCEAIQPKVDIQSCRDELVALGLVGPRRNKEFIAPLPDAIPGPDELAEEEAELWAELGAKSPQSELPIWSGIVNPAIYGVARHGDFLAPRQRITLLHLVRAIRQEHRRLDDDDGVGPAEVKFVIANLSALIDQIVDWNCRLSMWIPQNEQVGRAFCGPGVSMIWDYAEVDPVSRGPANLWAKLDRIIDGLGWLGEPPGRVHVLKAPAQNIPHPDNTFDAIVTDPPYYDNVYYSVLSDFFFTWKRLVLTDLEPELFGAASTDFAHELVASTERSGGAASAHEDYCQNFAEAIREAARVLKPEGLFALVFSHSSANAWEAVVRAYRAAPLTIMSVQGMAIERRQRPRAMTSVAVNTCIVLVAQARDGAAATSRTIADIAQELEAICESDFPDQLRGAGWSEADIGLTLFARGVGLLANADEVFGVGDDIEAMRALAAVVRASVSCFRLSYRKSL